MKFFNISNHPSSKWGEKQKAAAKQLAAHAIGISRTGRDENGKAEFITNYKLGDIVDVAFPNVPPFASPGELLKIAEEVLTHFRYHLDEKCPALVQGEFSLSKILIDFLQSLGWRIYCATTERKSIEAILPDGETKKETIFEFVGFREYPQPAALVDFIARRKAAAETKNAIMQSYDGEYPELGIVIRGDEIRDSYDNYIGTAPKSKLTKQEFENFLKSLFENIE